MGDLADAIVCEVCGQGTQSLHQRTHQKLHNTFNQLLRRLGLPSKSPHPLGLDDIRADIHQARTLSPHKYHTS